MRLTRWGGYWRDGMEVGAMVAVGHLAFLVKRGYLEKSLINICCFSMTLSISRWSHQAQYEKRIQAHSQKPG